MSSNTVDFDGETYDEYLPLLKPSKLILIIELASVVVGILLGVIGIYRSQAGATEIFEYEIGIAGYILTGIVPVVCYKLFSTTHKNSLKHNQEQPYDVHGGEKVLSSIRKIALAGLIAVGLPIWVFFLPIAQGLVK